jgi:hypothetical protein
MIGKIELGAMSVAQQVLFFFYQIPFGIGKPTNAQKKIKLLILAYFYLNLKNYV